jgi:hypothetical protein
VMDPNVDLAQLEKKMAWGSDPVHPQQLVYDKMASGLKIVEAKIGKRRGSVGDRGADKKTRTEAGRGLLEASPRSNDGGWRPVAHYGNWGGRGGRPRRGMSGQWGRRF